jgi:hypothetical protein
MKSPLKAYWEQEFGAACTGAATVSNHIELVAVAAAISRRPAHDGSSQQRGFYLRVIASESDFA